jgi:hypothetical protein
MKTLQFIKKYIWKKIDFDWKFLYQCKDLVNQYIQEVQWAKAPTWNAELIFQANWGNSFEKCENTPDCIPKLWDIVIWNWKYCEFWHIAIVIQADINHMIIFEQNGWNWNWDWKGWNAIKLSIKDYKNVIGFVRKIY